jgi:hypothetical protein
MHKLGDLDGKNKSALIRTETLSLRFCKYLVVDENLGLQTFQELNEDD